MCIALMVLIALLDLRQLFYLKVPYHIFSHFHWRFLDAQSVHFYFLFVFYLHDLQLNLV